LHSGHASLMALFMLIYRPPPCVRLERPAIHSMRPREGALLLPESTDKGDKKRFRPINTGSPTILRFLPLGEEPNLAKIAGKLRKTGRKRIIHFLPVDSGDILTKMWYHFGRK